MTTEFPSQAEIRHLAELALKEMQAAATTDPEAWIASYEKVIMSYRRLALAKQQLADSTRLPPPSTHVIGGDDDHMIQIADLISQLEAIHDRFGNTCVYIRRGGMGWGAVALNRRDDDKENGVFDLQAQHDRDMHARLEQIGRLRADREEAWRSRRDAEGSRDAAQSAADSLRIERDDIRSALKLAIDHIEHMAAFIAPKRLGYSFESLGEDMPGMKAALATATEGRADA